jgi:alpha-tubulin suppressor-like RCC1 family protein
LSFTLTYAGCNGFVQVAAGRFHGVALAADGSVWTWGDNETGAIGDGSTSPRAKPVKVGEGFARVAAGDYHTIALKSDGSLWAWGANEDGQLGDGTNLTRLSPVQIYPAPGAKDKADLPVVREKPAEPAVTAVRVGLYFSCASFSDGQYKCWGSNKEGQLGNDRRSEKNPRPLIVEKKGRVSILFASSRLTDCRILKAACDEAFSSFPFLRGASAIIAPHGDVHYDTACALKNGRIRCASRDDGGSSRWIVDGIHDASSFDYYNGNHGCAVLSDGRVKCWGSNQHGELGNGTTGYSLPGQPATEVVNLMP